MQYIYYYLSEIRFRGLYSLFAGGFSLTLSYIYKYDLFYLFSKPFLAFSKHFLFFELTEGFSTLIRISGIIALLTTIPYILFQYWSFLVPSYYLFERKKLLFFLKVAWFFFLGEFLFLYWVLFPKFCEFLLSFEIKSDTLNKDLSLLTIEFAPRIASYIQIVLHLFSFVFVIFQLPVLFVVLFTKNFLNSYTLCSSRKFVFFGCILISAFISPPELLSQLMFSIIFYCVYEIIIFLGFFFEPFSTELP